MSPYQQQVTDVAKAAAVREAKMADNVNKLAAARQGTYGGAREALGRLERERNLLSNLSNIQAQGNQAAYDKAIAAQQFGANLGLQGLQAGYQGLGQGIQGAQAGLSGLGTAMQGQQAGLAGLGQAGTLYGQGMQGAQTGLSGVGQQIAAGQLGLQGGAQQQQAYQTALSALGQRLAAGNLGLQGTSQGMQGAQTGLSGVGQMLGAGNLGLAGTAQGIQGAQAGMQGAGVGLSGVGQATGAGQYGLSGLGQATQAGATLGQLGTQQQAADINAINLQNQLGSQQQAYQQNIINQAIQDYATAQQYPYMQLGMMSNLLRGLPMQSMTTQQYQAAPSITSQLGGLGATALGAYGASGGFRGMKKGGAVKRYDVGGSIRATLEKLPDSKLIELAKTSPSQEIRKAATMLLAEHKLESQAEQPQQAMGLAAAPVPNFDSFNAATGGIVAFAGDTEDGSLVDERELRKKYNIADTSGLANVGNYLGYLQAKGFGKEAPEVARAREELASARKDLTGDTNRSLWQALMVGGAKAMQSKSPYALAGIGEGLEAGVGEYGKSEARTQDMLQKLRTGEIDLAKLSQTERNNLLHYGLTGAVSDANTQAKLREIAAGKERAGEDRMFQARLGAYNNAYTQIVKSMQDKVGINKMTADDYKKARQLANEAADDFVASAGGQKVIKLK